MPSQTKSVAVIGLGIMGSAIAENLTAAGFAVRGFDVEPGKMAAVAAVGGTPCGSAGEAARGCALALTSLPSIVALDATVDSLVAVPQPGLVVAELSTFPIEAKEAARRRLAPPA